MMKITKANQGQRGNVLFLILIAVALFAALSYAVTQSSRSGGNANRETNLLNSAQITQYPTGVKTAALRMIIDGTSVSNIYYTPPANFGTSSDRYVFHPTGGGAAYSEVPSNLMASGSAGVWKINGQFAINDIGTATEDIIAFLPDINLDVCKKINVELGLSATGDPSLFGSDVSAEYVKNYADYGPNNVTTFDTTPTTFPAAFDGESFGCFENGNSAGSGDYVYYHVITER